MSRRPIEYFLFDILVALLKIEYVANEFTYADQLKHDFKSWDSIIREFEIVGEATKHLIDACFFEQNKRRIVNFRNHVVHEYFGIDEEEVWHIIYEHLPLFKEEVVSHIGNIDSPLKSELINAFNYENRNLTFITTYLTTLEENI